MCEVHTEWLVCAILQGNRLSNHLFFEVCAQGVGRLSCFPGRTPEQLLDSRVGCVILT